MSAQPATAAEISLTRAGQCRRMPFATFAAGLTCVALG
jgi:hypothetical protein